MSPLLLLLFAHALDESARLTPTPADWDEAATEAEAALAQADAAMEATARVQNHWVHAELAGAGCDEEAVSVVARSKVFGTAWRDAVQAARIEVADAVPLLARPTLAPLVTRLDERRRDALVEGLARHERALEEARAWHASQLAPVGRRCGTRLAPAPGFERDEILARGERNDAAVAFAWVGPGVPCVDGEPVDGADVIVTRGRACVSRTRTCACAAQRVTAGAVIGPTVVTE